MTTLAWEVTIMSNKKLVATSAAGLLLMAATTFAKPAPVEESNPMVTFNKGVLPILQKNCQTCHRPGQIGPFSMLSYKETRPWAKAIKAAVASRTMPPWLADPRYGHFTNDRSLKQEDIETIVRWVDEGAAEGNPKDAPAPVQWPAAGWQIEPDVTVELPPFAVPARGILDWQDIAFPAPFKEDTWVTSMQVLPGESSVVHHLCFDFQKHKPTTLYNTYEWLEIPRDDEGITKNHEGLGAGARPAEGIIVTREVGSSEEKRHYGKPTLSANGTFCYLPGLPYEDYRPMNAGFLVPAGSDLIVSLHYTANGVGVSDKTRIGFTVAKAPPPNEFHPQNPETNKLEAVEQKSKITELAIPPNEGNYLSPPTEMTFNKDIELVSIRPHAHVRGKSVQYTLIYPDGREEIVLNVPRYDFNWQLTYRTAVKIPKGSRMIVQFVYDNSANNKYNPDPGKWVYYGQQSWEEMGTPFLGFLTVRENGQ